MTQLLVAGIDEAGRGPVFGPMVMAIAACEPERQDGLKKAGVADSKLLSPETRERLSAALTESLEHEIIELSPAEIDAAVEGKAKGDNLNRLEARTTALLIYRLAKRVSIGSVIIDSPTKSEDKYAAEIRAALDKIDVEGLTKKIKLQPEIKADANHAIVGAASILAKVRRDMVLRGLESKHGALGSGYPSDPSTQAFLAKNWREGHEFFRKSWESYKRLAAPKEQVSLSDFGSQAPTHTAVIAEFEQLREHGFAFSEPTNQYEVVRMKNDAGVTVIRYTTGKLVVQGPDGEKKKAEKLLRESGLD